MRGQELTFSLTVWAGCGINLPHEGSGERFLQLLDFVVGDQPSP